MRPPGTCEGMKNQIGKCVVPHGGLCSSLHCFPGLPILMFSYKVLMLAPDDMCSFVSELNISWRPASILLNRNAWSSFR
jgi:hypothetical protein